MPHIYLYLLLSLNSERGREHCPIFISISSCPSFLRGGVSIAQYLSLSPPVPPFSEEGRALPHIYLCLLLSLLSERRGEHCPIFISISSCPSFLRGEESIAPYLSLSPPVPIIFSTVILWPIAKATEFVLAQVSRWYAHICLTCRVTICSQAWLQLPGAGIFGPAPRSYNHAIACLLKHPWTGACRPGPEGGA